MALKPDVSPLPHDTSFTPNDNTSPTFKLRVWEDVVC